MLQYPHSPLLVSSSTRSAECFGRQPLHCLHRFHLPAQVLRGFLSQTTFSTGDDRGVAISCSGACLFFLIVQRVIFPLLVNVPRVYNEHYDIYSRYSVWTGSICSILVFRFGEKLPCVGRAVVGTVYPVGNSGRSGMAETEQYRSALHTARSVYLWSMQR